MMRVSRSGVEEEILAKAVIDASGTYASPNPLGGNGVPALGEQALAERIAYGIPDVLGAERGRYAGRRVMVVGSGHSAFNALLDLGRLAEQAPETGVCSTGPDEPACRGTEPAAVTNELPVLVGDGSGPRMVAGPDVQGAVQDLTRRHASVNVG